MPLPEAFIILTPGFPASENDSTCLPMQQRLVKQLAVAHPGTRVIVLSFQYPYHTNSYLWQGVLVHCFNGKNKGGFVRLRNRQKIYSRLEQLHKAFTIKGLLSFWYGECALVGSRFARRHQLVHRCWILGQDARSTNPYPRRVKAPADELMALSDFLQDEFQRNFKLRPAHLVTPAVDTGLLAKTKAEREIDILGVGSLIPLKRYALWVELIEKLRKQFPAIKAVLVGDGPELKALQQLAEKKQLLEHIRFTKELRYTDTLQLMQKSKILVHTSSYEGYSGVCQEAVYAGARVISFCQPMKTAIPNWLIVSDLTEMTAKAGALLSSDYDYEPPQPLRTLDELAAQLFHCFAISG